MYSHVKSCVKTDNGITDYFKCQIGVRQGCMLSPLLFSLYLNELIEMLQNCNGIYVNENVPNITTLMYADDLVLCSDSVGRLQQMIYVLETFCKNWGLEVNLTKTKAIVFRRGGPLRKNERWYFNGNNVEIVSYYKY
jgi:hypothetical protein